MAKVNRATDEKLAVFLKGKAMSVSGIEPLETQKRQLRERIQEELHFSQSDKAIGILKKFLTAKEGLEQ
ncbi:MAG: hypothetical protein V1933_03140 [Candidatus Omnitrophota bacterium]